MDDAELVRQSPPSDLVLNTVMEIAERDQVLLDVMSPLIPHTLA